MNDYDGARRAYSNAIKYAPENENILRDLSYLQIHTRDFKGFEESRLNLCMLKPGILINWVSCACAMRVNKNY